MARCSVLPDFDKLIIWRPKSRSSRCFSLFHLIVKGFNEISVKQLIVNLQCLPLHLFKAEAAAYVADRNLANGAGLDV